MLAGTVLTQLAPEIEQDMIDIQIVLFRIHQGLGRTNWARSLGLPEDTCNTMSWQNDALVGSLFTSHAINMNLVRP